MNQLYLLRHGLAVPHGTPGIEDDDRPLTPDGERRVRPIGRGLKRLKVKVVRIATSPLPRALKTAQIVAEAPGRARPGRGRRRTPRRPGRRVDPGLAGDPAGNPPDGRRPQPEPLRPARPAHRPATRTSRICELRKGGIAALRGEPGGLLPGRLDRPAQALPHPLKTGWRPRRTGDHPTGRRSPSPGSGEGRPVAPGSCLSRRSLTDGNRRGRARVFLGRWRRGVRRDIRLGLSATELGEDDGRDQEKRREVCEAFWA